VTVSFPTKICTALFLFILPALSFPQNKSNWRLRNRLQASYVFDDNIKEAAENSTNLIEDSSFRLLFESTATRRSKQLVHSLIYKGGVQAYQSNNSENKLINEIQFSSMRRIGAFGLGLRGFGRLKLYLNDQLDYGSGFVEFFVNLPKTLGFNSRLAVQRAGLSYKSSNDFDNSEWLFSFTVNRRLSSRLSLKITPLFSSRKFSARPVFSFEDDGTNELITVVDSDDNQLDRDFQVLTQLVYSKTFLVNLSYLAKQSNSNSELFSFTKHQLNLVVGVPFPKDFWLRLYLAAQVKSYSIENATLPANADPERTESNFVVVDFSKDLSQSLSALIRFAHYNNESVIRDLFYRKNLLTLGFDFRF